MKLPVYIYRLPIVVLWTICYITPVFLSECNVHVTKEACLTINSGTPIGQTCRWSKENRCHDARRRFDTEYRPTGHVTGKGARDYNPLLAYNYTLMSALAYSVDPKGCQSRLVPDTDFVLQHSIGSHCEDLPLFDYQECYAYTAVSNKTKTILVAYRGTEFPKKSSARQLIDQIISVLLIPKRKFFVGGRVQHYFKNAHDKLSPCVEKSLRNLTSRYPGYNVVVTGHSLGAALASLSAASLAYQGLVKSESLSVYQFGEPRVGDAEYAAAFDKLVPNSWRVVHNRDIVSHLPTCNLVGGCSNTSGGPYHTKTEVFYPNVDMSVTSPYKICAGNEDKQCSDGVISKHWCTSDIDDCINYHKVYFGIPVGTICDGPMKQFQKGQGQTRSRGDKGQGYGREGDMPDSCNIVQFPSNT